MSYQCLSETIANNQDKNTVSYAFKEIEIVPSTIHWRPIYIISKILYSLVIHDFGRFFKWIMNEILRYCYLSWNIFVLNRFPLIDFITFNGKEAIIDDTSFVYFKVSFSCESFFLLLLMTFILLLNMSILNYNFNEWDVKEKDKLSFCVLLLYYTYT